MPRSTTTGFALIESAIAVGVAVTLALVAVLNYRSYQQRFELRASAQEVVSLLQLVRERTLASDGSTSYGVHFETDRYVGFAGTTYDASAAGNDVHVLPTGVAISTIALSGGADVVFDRVRGTTSNPGTITLELSSSPDQTSTIRVLASGQVGLFGTVGVSGTRLTDSRHVHFTLGWSIQGASTLQLTFADPPNPDVQRDVAMAAFFNADQSTFDWQGTTAVGGEDQTLRVHTHALDAFNTVLSVRRDRRQNTKALTIAIDGQPVVSYAADGTPTVESGGGTMEVQ